MTQRSGGVAWGSIKCRVRAAAEPVIVPPFGGGVDIEAVDADRRRPEEPFPLSWVVIGYEPGADGGADGSDQLLQKCGKYAAA